ncbi:oligosaccharide flippase family protein [Phytohabitans rumicis]|uniref:Lipopolysaccharide biosynthesis protein n=1 Tax=Phytohabitans rumicis TaxID=1076125 RepID=A0A6V8L9C9_9ACTN|nr:oligosaccharide flippase family protein [Phytohabitans rumicis]GFJ89305.1 lipopolysaccharide biosynthesis protein [Phytohabitans rumicis]
MPQEASHEFVSKIKKALVWSTVNNLLLRFGNLGLGIILARLLAPEDFGAFAVALTLQNVLLALADLGLSADLIRTGDIEGRAATATTLTTASGAVFALVMCLAAGPFANAMGSPGATSVVQVISLTLVLAGMSCVPYAIMQRDFRQPEQTALGLIALVLDMVITVSLVLAGLGAMALAISRVITQSTTTAVQFWMVRMRPKFGWDRNIARGLVRFGIPLAAANLVYMAIVSVPNLMVGSMMGSVALGFFLLAFNISSWPLNALGAAVRAVALPGFARLTDPDRKAQGFGAAVAVTAAWSALAGLLLSALAATVVPLLYGEKWLPAAGALAGLAVYGAIRIVVELMGNFLVAVGATKRQLVAQLVWIGTLVPAMAIGIKWAGLSGAGWANAAVAGLVIVPAYLLLARRYRVRVAPIVGRIGLALVAAVPAAAAGIFASGAVDNLLLACALGGTAATAVYAGLLYLPFRRWLAQLVAMKEYATEAAAEPLTTRDPQLAEVTTR